MNQKKSSVLKVIISLLILLLCSCSGGFPKTLADIKPEPGTVIDNTDAPVRFSWPSIEETAAYRIEVSDDPEFRSSLLDKKIEETELEWPDTTSDDTVLYWRIIPVADSRWIKPSWYGPWEFKIDRPDFPELRMENPVNGVTVKNSGGILVSCRPFDRTGLELETEFATDPDFRNKVAVKQGPEKYSVSFAELIVAPVPDVLYSRSRIINRHGDNSEYSPTAVVHVSDPLNKVPDGKYFLERETQTEKIKNAHEGITVRDCFVYKEPELICPYQELKSGTKVTRYDLEPVEIMDNDSVTILVIPIEDGKWSGYINTADLMFFTGDSTEYDNGTIFGISYKPVKFLDNIENSMVFGVDIFLEVWDGTAGSFPKQYPLSVVSDTDNEWIIPDELYLQDVTGNGRDEIFISGAITGFRAYSDMGIGGYGQWIFSGGFLTDGMDHRDFYEFTDQYRIMIEYFESNDFFGSTNSGEYLYRDTDGDGIRETLYATRFSETEDYMGEEDPGTAVITSVLVMERSTGKYEYVSSERHPALAKSDYYQYYPKRESNYDMLHLGK